MFRLNGFEVKISCGRICPRPDGNWASPFRDDDRARAAHLVVYGRVQDGQRAERYEVHDDQVHPVYVDGYVFLVVAQLAGVHLVHVLAVAGVHALLHAHLPEPGDVVQHGEHDDGHDVGARPPVRAQRARLQRVAHGHEPFQRDGKRQVDGHGLRDHRYRVDDGRDQRVHLEVVVEQVVGARVDHGQPEQQYGRDDQHGVAPGQPDQQVVDGRLHLRPGQYDHRDHVAQDAEHADHVQQHAVRDELEQQVVVVHLVVRGPVAVRAADHAAGAHHATHARAAHPAAAHAAATTARASAASAATATATAAHVEHGAEHHGVVVPRRVGHHGRPVVHGPRRVHRGHRVPL